MHADHDGLRVGLTGQPDQCLGDRPGIGHRPAVRLQTRLPGERGTTLC